MIFSMTGFANASRELGGVSLTLDLRAVNHRYLEAQFRMPDELRIIEPQMREQISGRLSRGKVDCRIQLNVQTGAQTTLSLNQVMLEQLAALTKQVRQVFPDSGDLKMGELLRWPGVLETQDVPAELLQQTVLEMLAQALEDFTASRRREGGKLAEMILQRVDRIEVLVTEVEPKIPALLAAYQEKISLRLKEAMVNGEDDRIRQEFALFAQKIDVDEEISRLRTHLGELRRILKAGGTVGKRLDFLMQELNREANTLGSKSVSAEVSQTSMELKVLIEQMREQIQNIE
ncbi:YicC/YloC family endoribonuclease [Chitinivorax sp. B]|uniref:YicC/YloC family endoribonuclease n=1 Tax=Chitinivorax sp. B TaxID=2502235 RepID=UPI0010F85A82|nr:YicC/YloC family endoribonuclease [Chitinivorax sp. B]